MEQVIDSILNGQNKQAIKQMHENNYSWRDLADYVQENNELGIATETLLYIIYMVGYEEGCFDKEEEKI